MTATERLNEFTEARLRHPDNRNLNLLNTSLAAWRRYHDFLLILRDQYQKTSAEFVSAMQPELEAMKSEPSGPRPVTRIAISELSMSGKPRLSFGTVWDGSGKTKIAPGFLYPEPGEAETMQNPTGDIDEILLLLDNYIIAILDLFDANAEKSILPPPETEGGGRCLR